MAAFRGIPSAGNEDHLYVVPATNLLLVGRAKYPPSPFPRLQWWGTSLFITRNTKLSIDDACIAR